MANLIKSIGPIHKKYNIIADFNKYDMVFPTIYNKRLLNYLGCGDLNNNFYKEININGLSRRYLSGRIIIPVSEYEPFYPENFYSTWETLCKLNLDLEGDMLLIDGGKEKPLGHIEATTKWFEDHRHYENNSYTRVPLNKINPKKNGKYDKFYHTYRNQITQAYPKADNIYKAVYNYNKKIGKLNYEFVVSSCDAILDNLLPLILCKKGGHIILQIDNIINDNIILDLLQVYKDYATKSVFYKPKCEHPLDPGYHIYFQKTKELDKSDVVRILGLLVKDHQLDKQKDNNVQNKQIEKIRMDYDNKVVEFFDFLREGEGQY